MKYLILCFTLIFIFSACKPDNNKSNGKNEILYNGVVYSVESFEMDSGWGYKIYKDNDAFIKQEVIPAVNGYFVFDTKEKAQITGEFVLQKLISQPGLPSVSIEELDSLGVLSQEILDYQKIDFSTKKNILPPK